MKLSKFCTFSIIVLIAVLSFNIELVRSDISDDECGIETTTIANIPTTQKPDPVSRTKNIKRSLLIIFDSTGSMSTDLAQLRSAAKQIVGNFSARAEKPIQNYVLSVYNDPGVTPALSTESADELYKKLDEIKVSGT
jgi:hypothetical protein